MITITRKIQINFIVNDKSELKALYEKIYGWQRICRRAANWIITHHYIQENIKELFYLTDETNVKLSAIGKDADGILTTSSMNTTYQVLSKNFKSQIPMGMLSGLNTIIVKTYRKETKEVWRGDRSIRNYRKDIPMPIRMGDVSNIKKGKDGNYSFFVYGISFKTYFGHDLSQNEALFDRAIRGEYKLCDSSMQIDDGKMFLLTVFSFEPDVIYVDPEKSVKCFLDPSCAIRIEEKNDKFFEIGNAEEFLYRRIAINGACKRLQKNLKYAKGGKGRNKKLIAIDRFKKKETHYIHSKLHLYSRLLINYCLKRKIGKIILENYDDVVAETKNDVLLLENWSYYGLSSLIEYKAKMAGIIVEKTEIKINAKCNNISTVASQ